MKSEVEFKKFAEFWTLIPKEIDIVFHEKRRDENAVHDIHDGKGEDGWKKVKKNMSSNEYWMYVGSYDVNKF